MTAQLSWTGKEVRSEQREEMCYVSFVSWGVAYTVVNGEGEHQKCRAKIVLAQKTVLPSSALWGPTADNGMPAMAKK
jgi:hypothetical protein